MIDIDLILNRKTAQVGDKLGIVVEIFSNRENIDSYHRISKELGIVIFPKA